MSCCRSERPGPRPAGPSSCRTRGTILLLLLLAVAITANLLGAVRAPGARRRAQPAGSFGTGALAAFVATPCAGPFLGAALGAALLLPLAGSIAGVRGARTGSGAAVPGDRLHAGDWRSEAAEAGAVDEPAAANPRHSDGADGIACLWLLDRQAGQAILLFGTFAALALIVCIFPFAGHMQRRGKRQAIFAGICAVVVVVAAVAGTPCRERPPASGPLRRGNLGGREG